MSTEKDVGLHFVLLKGLERIEMLLDMLLLGSRKSEREQPYRLFQVSIDENRGNREKE